MMPIPMLPMKAPRLVTRLAAAGGLVLAASLNIAAASAATDVTGVWLNDTGRGAVEIKPCGDAMCGHVVWVKDGGDAKGCGRQIIGDAQAGNGGVWSSGWIYSPERKRRYDVELKALDQDRLRVVGFAGSKFFSKTMIWKRAPDGLQRCGETVANAPAATAKPAEAATAEPSQTVTSKPAAETQGASDSSPAQSPEARLRAELRDAEAPPAPTKQAAAEPDTADTGEGTKTADAGDLGLGNLKLDKYLKRKDGKCDLDLPWVKVSFNCEEK